MEKVNQIICPVQDKTHTHESNKVNTTVQNLLPLNYSSLPFNHCLEGERGPLWKTGQACQGTVETDKRLKPREHGYKDDWNLDLHPAPPPPHSTRKLCRCQKS